MKNALWVVIILLLLLGGYYIFTSQAAPAAVPAAATTPTPQVTNTDQNTVQKPSANQGASGVYDPNAPQGSAQECAQCDQYSGAQKAQCLAALHC